MLQSTISKKSSVSRPDRLPDLFLDRSLGPIEVPKLLREAGLYLVTLSENYGETEGQDVKDEVWSELAGTNG
ncbi:hypothetical protein [Candidatus Poriferisocius sp.]|uniref:hypothetical protein n=1 Tax=Candidatus Poriferisocius sp. TaxID=3101276 RepID=UPI003B599D72